MGYLHDRMVETIDRVYSKKNVTAIFFKKVLAQKAVSLTDEEMANLVAVFTDEKNRGMEIPDSLTGGVHFTNEDFSVVLEDFEGGLSKAVEAAIETSVPEVAKQVLAKLYDDAGDALRDRMKIERRFTRNLRQFWAGALERLKMLLIISQEVGEATVARYRKTPAPPEDTKLVDALIALHCRGTRIACEIVCLLENGFADGAHARWRSLHEHAVFAMFIYQHRGDVPERYLSHAAIEEFKAAENFNVHCGNLGYAPIDAAQIDRLRKNAEVQKLRFGDEFRHELGWAAAAMNDKKPTFEKLEKSLNLDKWRPYYKMACKNIHASSGGLFWSLGSPDFVEPHLLSGPSNAGLADPGHDAAISLSQLTSALLTAHGTFDELVQCQVVFDLAEDIGAALQEAHGEMMADLEREADDQT